MNLKKVLAIETSCDDTSVALVRTDGYVEACLSAHQDLVHKPFGGVVPEIASRNHTLQILPLIEELQQKQNFDWNNLLGIAVTSRPGLIGSLLVGVMTAKTLAQVHNLKIIGINHLEAHLLAAFLHDDQFSVDPTLNFPYLALAISGGHTQLYWVTGLGEYKVLGRTVDDAAGEAFDKFAKYLGLGFPGGVELDRLSQTGRADAYAMPRTMIKDDGLDFSFSGLKSAAIRMVEPMSIEERSQKLPDLCASFQEAVVDSLMIKLDRAAQIYRAKNIVLTGGVSANSRLRSVATVWAKKSNFTIHIPPIRYCTDNAAMVGYAGAQRLLRGEFSDQNLSTSAGSLPGDFLESSR